MNKTNKKVVQFQLEVTSKGIQVSFFVISKVTMLDKIVAGYQIILTTLNKSPSILAMQDMS